MIQAASFMHQARERGFRLFTGMPCSYLKPFINYALDAPELDYVGAANEGDAVAIAAGADLAGQRSVVMFQNSGLGNAVNPRDGVALGRPGGGRCGVRLPEGGAGRDPGRLHPRTPRRRERTKGEARFRAG